MERNQILLLLLFVVVIIITIICIVCFSRKEKYIKDGKIESYDCEKEGCTKRNDDSGQYSTLIDCQNPKTGCDKKYCLKCDGTKASNPLNNYITTNLQQLFSNELLSITVPKKIDIPSLIGTIYGDPLTCCAIVGYLKISWNLIVPSIDNISGLNDNSIIVTCINLETLYNSIRATLSIQLNCSASIDISPANITVMAADGMIPLVGSWIKGSVDIGFTLTGNLDVTFSNPVTNQDGGKFLRQCGPIDWDFKANLNTTITDTSISETACRLQDTVCAPAKLACQIPCSSFQTGCNTCCYWNDCRCDTCPGSGGDPNNCSGCPDWRTRCGYCHAKGQQCYDNCDAKYNECHQNCTDTINSDLQSLAQDIEKKVHLSNMIDKLNQSVTDTINTQIPIILPKIVIPHKII